MNKLKILNSQPPYYVKISKCFWLYNFLLTFADNDIIFIRKLFERAFESTLLQEWSDVITIFIQNLSFFMGKISDFGLKHVIRKFLFHKKSLYSTKN